MIQVQEIMEQFCQGLAQKFLMINEAVEQVHIELSMPEDQEEHGQIKSALEPGIDKAFEFENDIVIYGMEKFDQNMKKFIFIFGIERQTNKAILLYLATNHQDLNQELVNKAQEVSTKNGFELEIYRDWARHSFLSENLDIFCGITAETMIQIQ